MRLNQCKRHKILTIQNIRKPSSVNRLDSFGLYRGHSIENTGLFFANAQIILCCDRILAVPEKIAKDILV